MCSILHQLNLQLNLGPTPNSHRKLWHAIDIQNMTNLINSIAEIVEYRGKYMEVYGGHLYGGKLTRVSGKLYIYSRNQQ